MQAYFNRVTKKFMRVRDEIFTWQIVHFQSELHLSEDPAVSTVSAGSINGYQGGKKARS